MASYLVTGGCGFIGSHLAGRDHAYGTLPQPNSHHSYALSADYVQSATTIVADQPRKAGVRLAFVLNQALSEP